MLPLIAILLPVILLLTGFAVDLAYMQNVRQELRAATDIAARVAANTLSRTDKTTEAVKDAKNIASENLVAGKPLVIENGNIVFGRSTPDANGRYTFQPNGSNPNSAQVTGFRFEGTESGGVPLFFGRLYGKLAFEPSQTSVATFLNVDICLVLDESSSMKVNVDDPAPSLSPKDPGYCAPPSPTSRWMALDAAVHVFTQILRENNAEEQVAVAVYNSADKKVCGGSNFDSRLVLHLTEQLDLVDAEIETQSASNWNGRTYIEAGMRTGLQELKSPRVRKYSDKIMIVLTDGNENVGSAVAAAYDCAAAHVVIHTITFSDYANQDLMRQVAAIGRGEHHHASDQAELELVFRELAAWVARLTQ